jgi:hypothetical protein
MQDSSNVPNFSENAQILERVKELKGYSGHGSNRKLADFLDVSESVISNWKSRSPIDLGILRKKLEPAEFFYASTGQKTQGAATGRRTSMERKFVLTEDQFNAVQRAGQLMESLMRAVPAELREEIDTRQMGYYLAQAVDYLLAGEQEKILEMQAHFLSQVPRKVKREESGAIGLRPPLPSAGG